MLALLLAAGIVWLFGGQERPSESPPGGPVSSTALDYWSDKTATRQRIDAEYANHRVVLGQQAQDRSNGPYRQRILEFLDLTAKLHSRADQRWEEAIRRKDTRGEAGYALANNVLSVGLYQMSGVIDEYSIRRNPSGPRRGKSSRQKAGVRRLPKDFEPIFALIKVRPDLRTPHIWATLLDRASRVLDEGDKILAGGDDFGALLAWVEASSLELYVNDQCVAFLGLLEPASAHDLMVVPFAFCLYYFRERRDIATRERQSALSRFVVLALVRAGPP